MENKNELQSKINHYESEIKQLTARLAQLDTTETFQRMESVQINSTLKNYQDRIARLQRRINDIPEPHAVTDHQVKMSDWATSKEYDEL